MYRLGLDPIADQLAEQKAQWAALHASKARLREYHAHAVTLVLKHGLQWIQSPKDRSGDGSAWPSRRQIFCGPITSEIAFGTFVHETSHAINRTCKGAHHFRDPDVKGQHNCLGCEVDAWKLAIELAKPFEFTRAMRQDMARALRSYQTTTPGDVRAIAELEKLVATAPPECDERSRPAAPHHSFVSESVRTANRERFGATLALIRAMARDETRCPCGQLATRLETLDGQTAARCHRCSTHAGSAGSIARDFEAMERRSMPRGAATLPIA